MVHQTPNRDYGIVWLSNGENVAIEVLREGWARCRPGNSAVASGQVPPLEASLDNLSIEYVGHVYLGAIQFKFDHMIS